MKTKKRFVSVTPKTALSKNRFANLMSSLHSCEIKEETDDMFFLASINGQYCFWVQKKGNEHWQISK